MPIIGSAAARQPLLTSMDAQMTGRGAWAIGDEEAIKLEKETGKESGGERDGKSKSGGGSDMKDMMSKLRA